jgi:Ni/Fe-hydrogenase 1 B-type cytochrome subunit
MATPEAPADDVLAPVYVYELPVRIWHWITAPAIVVLAVTGFLIARPVWPQINGEPSTHYIMGDIRVIHFTAGYILAIGFIGRLYWAIMGNKYAREIFIPHFWQGAWWGSLFQTIRWYLFLERESGRKVGHNPLAQLAMFLMFVLGVMFQICTGFALYGEGAGGWSHALFTSWVIPLFGGSEEVHTWHHLGMWYLVIYVIVHVYIAIREDIMSRQTMISTMINGWRFFKDNRP